MAEPVAPCGLCYCPLPHENRFFAEAQENLLARDWKERKHRLNSTLRIYCQGHRIQNIEPDFDRCRRVLERVTEEDPEIGPFVTNLQRELRAIATQEHHKLSPLVAPF